MSNDQDVLRSEFDLDFTYTRTYGPVMSQFFTALKNQKVMGIKTSDGKVVCPPVEYDPKTAEDLTDLVELSAEGTITTWSWVNEPMAKHPLQKPFAWALIKIDGADTAMLHAVDAPKDQVKTGAKVKIRWNEERVGWINDIACFELA
jgi:hypothetical protein